jgi:hypothetical protein
LRTVGGTIQDIAVLRNPKLGGTALSRLHDNLHIVPQSDEEAHQTLHRIPPELAASIADTLG